MSGSWLEKSNKLKADRRKLRLDLKCSARVHSRQVKSVQTVRASHSLLLRRVGDNFEAISENIFRQKIITLIYPKIGYISQI